MSVPKIAVTLLALVLIGGGPADARKKDNPLVRNRGEPFCYWFGLLRDCKTGAIEGRDETPKLRKVKR